MANRLIEATGLAFALLVPANGWTEGLLHVSPRPGSEAGGLNVSHPALAGNVLDFRTCEAVLDGNRDFGLFRVKLAPPNAASQSAWSTNSGSCRYEWTYPEGITVRFQAVPRAESVELAYTVVNHTTAPLKQVHLHTCVTTTESPVFFPQLTTGRESQLPPDMRDKDYTELLMRLFVWSGGHPPTLPVAITLNRPHPLDRLRCCGMCCPSVRCRATNPSGMKAWLGLLGADPLFTLPPEVLRLPLGRLRRLVQRRPPQSEWAVHSELTEPWGELLAARKVFTMPKTAVPPSVARVLEAVFANPARDWHARELAGVAGASPTHFRERSRA